MVPYKPWSELFPELLEPISDSLPLADFINFRGVCQKWRSAPSRRAHITNFSKDSPWLLFYGFKDDDHNIEDKCYLYTDSHPECCILRLPHLRGATAVKSKLGWLLAHRGKHFFFYNPFSLQKIDLPPLPSHAEHAYRSCTFRFFPTSPNCTILLSNLIEKQMVRLRTCQVGDSKWEEEKIMTIQDWLSTMLAADCCSCTGDNDGWLCKCNKKINFYCKSSMVLTFDCESKSIVGKRHCLDGGHGVFKRLGRLHYSDWLHRFGDKIFPISLSSINVRRVGEPPGFLLPWKIVLKDGDATMTELNGVKAVEIEPYIQQEKKFESG